MVISYLRRYEVIGIVVRNRDMKDPVDTWIDLDDLKSSFIAKSDAGEISFLMENKHGIGKQ